MNDKIYNVLFLCTGNSARSIFAESLINRLGRGRFRGYSAGSHPAGEVNPLAIEELKSNNFVTTDLRSKDWSEFAAADAPEMDFVFTVCDKAVAETCPVWPGCGCAGITASCTSTADVHCMNWRSMRTWVTR